MKDVSVFNYTQTQFQEFAQDILKYAKTIGATDASVELNEGNGLSVNVHCGEIETIEQNNDKNAVISVFIGKKRGYASTSDFSMAALKATVDAAYNIANFAAQDDSAGLPEDELFARAAEDLKLFYPWEISAQEAADIAKTCEEAAFSVDKNIKNSDGASVYAQQNHFFLANSRGFSNGYPYSKHSIFVSPIASVGGSMQRDDWFSTDRNYKKLAAPEEIGRYAAKRALARLNAKQLETRNCPVLFEAPVAVGLVSALVNALSGGALYRKASFLLDSIEKRILPEHINMYETPSVIGALGSAPFDDEGVRTNARNIIEKGIVKGYFLSTYSARKLGMKSTGNAGGAHNLYFTSSDANEKDVFETMLKKMGTGLLVTELLGHGINFVTGDYSRGASGYWVENGVIRYPVEEITIAGNLSEMFAQIAAVGADVITRGTIETGSILIENMKVAGR